MDFGANRQLITFFQAYNKRFSKACDQALMTITEDTGLEECPDEESLGNLARNDMQDWFSQPFSQEYPGLTGQMIIDRITDQSEAVELAAYAAVYCDDDLPDPIRIKLGSFGSPVLDAMTALILQFDWEDGSDPWTDGGDLRPGGSQELAVAISFLRLLGDWAQAEQAGRILDKFLDLAEPDEAIADAVRYYLVALGSRVIPVIIKRISQSLADRPELNPAAEYVLIALADSGKNDRQGDVFNCLKASFRKMKNKVIGAICLGDYGDPRGIMTLKGWLDQHPEVRDRQLISEILSSVRRLGGDISDVRHHLNRSSAESNGKSIEHNEK